MARRSTVRGFTLVEMLVAVAIGAFGVAVAASVARTTAKESGRSNQVTELSTMARLLGHQIRADLQLAGFGSTGAISADCGQPMWLGICAATPGRGFNAIPAIRGANALSGVTVSSINVMELSDAVQVVVPDPSTLERTTRAMRVNSTTLFVDNIAGGLNGCRIVLISDHSAPNGAGRTQLMVTNGGNNPNPTSPDRLQFPVSQGADVMCARVSTYWVDDGRYLRRSDLDPDVAPVLMGTSGITVNPSATGDDRVAPGVVDMQIAYRVSSELRSNRNALPEARWAYSGQGAAVPNENALANNGPSAWFEIRQARVNLMLRTRRAVSEPGDPISEPAMEDRGQPILIPRAYARYVLRTSAVMTNLRLFDMVSPEGLVAEPY